MGLFGFGKKNTTPPASNQQQKTKFNADLLSVGASICDDIINVCDGSTPEERELVSNARNTMGPSFRQMMTNPSAAVPQGVVGVLQVVCVSIIKDIDGSNQKERELIQNANTLFYLIKDMPSNVHFE